MADASFRWLWNHRTRLWPALATVCLPYVFLVFVYQPSVFHLLKNPDWTAELQNLRISEVMLDRFAQNVHGIFMFGIASAFLRATAIAAVILSVTILARQ